MVNQRAGHTHQGTTDIHLTKTHNLLLRHSKILSTNRPNATLCIIAYHKKFSKEIFKKLFAH